MPELRPLLLLLMVLLTACTSVQSRAGKSSLECMRAARAQLPAALTDKQQHCLASAYIARQCSVTEAYLAGIGKELQDLFGAGDANWADWRADRHGIACRSAGDVDAVLSCCAVAD